MSQHDYILNNATGAAFRSDLNAALDAVLTQNSGSSAPTTTKPYMYWASTSDDKLKQRNADNTAWIDVATLSTGAALQLPNGIVSTNKLDSTNGIDPILNSINGGPLAGFRNYIINGSCQISQRGTSGPCTTTPSYGPVDRFRTAIVGGATGVSATTTWETQWYQNFASSNGIGVSGTWTNGNVWVDTILEDITVLSLYGKTVTVSASVWQDTGSTVDFRFYIGVTNAGPNNWLSGVTYPYVGPSVNVPHQTVTKVSATFTLTANIVNGLEVILQGGVSSVTNKNFRMGNFQLEVGTKATVPEVRPYSTELALCKRYYVAGKATPEIFCAPVTTANTYYQSVIFEVPMRISPTTINIVHNNVYSNGFPTSNPSLHAATKDGFVVAKTSNATTPAGMFAYTWSASAEI